MRSATSPERVRTLRTIRFVVLAVTAIMVGHAAVYAVHHGVAGDLERAMRAGGHDGYWTILSIVVAASALLIVGRAAVRLLALGRALRDVRAAEATAGGIDDGLPTYRRELWLLTARLLPVVLVGYTVQENLEHLLGHGHVLGIAPLLGDGHPFALPVLAFVSITVAAVGALVRWRIAVLTVRLAHATSHRSHLRPTPILAASRWGLAAASCAHRWISRRRDAGRAPPALGVCAFG